MQKYRIDSMKPKVKTSNLLCPQRDCIAKVGTHFDDRPIIGFLNEKAIENEMIKRIRIRERRAAQLRRQMQRESSTQRITNMLANPDRVTFTSEDVKFNVDEKAE